MQYSGRLDQIEVRFEELTRQLADPAVTGDGEQYRKAAKGHSELSETVSKYREWKKASIELGQARAMLSDSDPELKQMAQEEVGSADNVRFTFGEMVDSSWIAISGRQTYFTVAKSERKSPSEAPVT